MTQRRRDVMPKRHYFKRHNVKGTLKFETKLEFQLQASSFILYYRFIMIMFIIIIMIIIVER